MADRIGSRLERFFDRLIDKSGINLIYIRASSNNSNRGDVAISLKGIPSNASTTSTAATTGAIPDASKPPRNFAIRTTDLVISGQKFLPAQNDRILEEINDEQLAYKVSPPDLGGACFTYQSGYRHLDMIKIYTRYDGVTDVSDDAPETIVSHLTDCITAVL